MSRRNRAILSLVVAAAFWAGNYVFGHVAVESMSPFSIVFLRWAIALIPLVLIAQLAEHPDWRMVIGHWRFLLYAALHVSTAFAASLINAANPALIALVALVVLHERIGWRGAVGIALALLGVLVVLTRGDIGTLTTSAFGSGTWLMLGAIAVWTVYSIAGRMGPKLPPVTAVTVQAAFVVTGLAVVAPFVGVTIPKDAPGVTSLLFIAIFPSCLSYVLWNTALDEISPGKAGVFLNLITLFTAIWALATGETISVSQIVGGLAIIVGVLLTTLPRHGKEHPVEAGAGISKHATHGDVESR